MGLAAHVTTGRLSTHVLDTTTGRPAPGIKVTLHEIGGSARGLIAEAVTNTDGRTDKPLISGEPLRIGTYELTFQVGGYFRRPAFSTPCRSASASRSRRGTTTCRCS